jgi:general secretion pathway protein F
MGGQLAQASSILESRSRRRIATLTTLAGPVMTLALGVLIGGIVLTLLSAIMSVNDLAV